MFRFLFLVLTCAGFGYLAYPHLNAANGEAETPAQLNIILLNSVSQEEIIGSWALSPRSTSILSNSLGTSGKRAGLSLESWGGGTANFVIGERHISGPIAWSARPGVGKKPATLHIKSRNDELILKFSKLEERLILVAEADRVSQGKKQHLSFLKAS